MPFLSHLAPEIHLCIADNLGQRDVNAFARTNRRFFNLLNPFLYRHNVQHHGSSAIWWAIQHGEEATVECLFNHGVDPQMRNLLDDDTLLTRAIFFRVEGDRHSDCPICGASLHSSLVKYDSIITLLLDRGVDVNARGSHNKTALLKACEGETESLVRLLIDRGADVHATNRKGMTALHLAAGYTANEALFRLLIQEGVSVHSKDIRGRTPLYDAIATANIANMRLLIGKGADVNLRDRDQVTPLLEAVGRYRYLEIAQLSPVIELLVGNGADIKAVGASNNTVLHRAVECGTHENLVQKLLDMGADPEARDSQGYTAMRLAQLYARSSLVEKLSRRSARLAKKPRIKYEEDNEEIGGLE